MAPPPPTSWVTNINGLGNMSPQDSEVTAGQPDPPVIDLEAATAATKPAPVSYPHTTLLTIYLG